MPKSDAGASNDEQQPDLLADDEETTSALVGSEPVETADSGGGAPASDLKPPKQSSRGAWVIVVLLVLVLGGLGYWYWYKTKDLNQQITTNTAKIAALEADKTKLEEAKKVAEAKAKDDSGSYVTIKEWNIQFKPVDKLSGVNYAIKGGSISYFSTTSLMSSALTTDKKPDSGSLCDVTEGAIGSIARGKKGEEFSVGQMFENVKDAKKIGDYYYVLVSPQSTCSEDKATADLQTAQIKLLKESFVSIRAAE